MPRTAKLSQKNGHWYSQAGGGARYYGKVGEVSHAEAVRRFREALAKPKEERKPLPSVTVAELVDRFLGWVAQHRSSRTHQTRAFQVKRFAKAFGKIKAESIEASHLECFLRSLSRKGAAPEWQSKHEVSVRAMIRWGVRHGHLPAGFSPFIAMEPIRSPIKALLEADLPTSEQVKSLIANATPELADLLRVQHATGARTGELLKSNVRDYQSSTHQIVIANHKRATTMRDRAPRVIILNPRANGIVSRLCEGRNGDDPIFTTGGSQRWRDSNLCYHYGRARTAAKVPNHITPYSLRHLWISEALMAGVDVFLVARMAGTSVAMIERVYGRFRIQSLADAQSKLDASRE